MIQAALAFMIYALTGIICATIGFWAGRKMWK